MHRDSLNRIAEALEDGYGAYPPGRAALMIWIETEIIKLEARGVVSLEATSIFLGLAYWAWLGGDWLTLTH